jgi:histidinol dehydrogenase
MKPRILKSGTPEFKQFLASIMARRGGDDGSRVDAAVTDIIAEVRRRGDAALIDYTERFDRVKLTPKTLRVSAKELRDALAQLPREDRRALELAAKRIAAFHKKTIEKPFLYTDDLGMRLGQLVRPLDRAGIYVPGGMGAYPSSVLMNAIPARVAGVREIVMVSPPSVESERPEVMAAAAIAGVSEFYRVGGAHAVAALAYGTPTIAPVDKIVGPGNAYVQAAKRMVYGVVDIDKMAGPSEVLVIADDSAHPDWVAADLIAQAEHGSGDESALLLTPSRQLAEAVSAAITSGRALSADGGETITISRTPATRAGIAFISTDDGYAPSPPGT